MEGGRRTRVVYLSLTLLLFGAVIATPVKAATMASPTIIVTPSSPSATVGGSVYETATLSGGNSPTGRVVYYYYQNGNCSAEGDQIGNVTVTGNANALNSFGVTFSSPGTYSFQATYTGDGNNNPATSACVPLTVLEASSTTLPPSTSTAVVSSSSSSSMSSSADLALVVGAIVVIVVLGLVVLRGRSRNRGSAAP